ncbi:hypothetical protein D3C71_1672110 [compost metagenome]
MERLGALLPKPIKLGVPASPPAIVVRVTGMPDAKGIIAPPFVPPDASFASVSLTHTPVFE